MRFELYTSLTVSKGLSALTQRMHAKPTASRPDIDGWVEKGGRFSISVSTQIAKQFRRTTHLSGELEREGSVTVIRARVATGASPEQLRIIFAVAVVLGLVVLASGNGVLGLLIMVLGFALYIPLSGDCHNSSILMKELRNALKAKKTPPK